MPCSIGSPVQHTENHHFLLHLKSPQNLSEPWLSMTQNIGLDSVILSSPVINPVSYTHLVDRIAVYQLPAKGVITTDRINFLAGVICHFNDFTENLPAAQCEICLLYTSQNKYAHGCHLIGTHFPADRHGTLQLLRRPFPRGQCVLRGHSGSVPLRLSLIHIYKPEFIKSPGE